MATRYEQIIANVQSMVNQGAPSQDIDGYLSVEGLSASQFKKLAAGPTIGGQTKEFFKGVVPGAVGLGETAITGAAALLPEEMEQGVRKYVGEKTAGVKKAFAPELGYEDTVGRRFGEGFGSTVPFFALGPFGAPGLVAGAGLGVAAGAGEARQAAEAAGATGEERSRATLLGAPTGLLDTLAPQLRPFKNVLVTAAARGGIEGLTEAAQKVAQNLIAKGVYNPEQPILVGSGEEGAYGAGVGALASLIVDMTLGRRTRGGGGGTGTQPPGAPIPATAQQEMFGTENAGFRAPPEPYRAAEEKEAGQQNRLFQITEMRGQFDVLEREMGRLKQQYETPDISPEQKQAILTRADELNTARTDLESQIKKLSKGVEGVERAGAAPEPEQRGLDFDMPAMPRQKTGEGTVLGEKEAQAPGLTPEQADMFREERVKSIQARLNAGQMVTPADTAFLRMTKAEQQAEIAARPTPELYKPEITAQPTSELYVPEAQPEFQLGQQYTQPAPAVAPAAKARPITEADFKAMGVASTNKKLRAAILGKDLTDPAQRAEVQDTLTDFANNPNRSASIIAKVNNFLSSPTFMDQGEFDFNPPTEPSVKEAEETTDVVESTEPIATANEPSVPVVEQQGATPAAGIEAPVTGGMGAAPAVTGGPDVGTEVQPPALTTTEPKESRIAKYRKEAANIESSLPPVPEGMTRLWRGNRQGEVGKNPQFTNALVGIALPFRDAYQGPLSYVDVPTNEVSTYVNTGVAAEGAEFILPPRLAAQAKQVSGTPSTAVSAANTDIVEGQANEILEPKASAALGGPKPGTAVSAANTNIIEGQFRVIDEGTIAPAVAQLSAPEQQTLAEHYGKSVNSPAFLEKLRRDISNFATKGAQAVDKAIRNIIRKLHAAVLATAVIMNPNYMSAPIPVAIPKTVTTIEQVKAVVPAEVAKNMSPSAQMAFANIFPAIQADLKAKNKFFVLTDKPNARVFIFTADGKPVLSKKVLVGKTMGDFYKGNTNIVSNRVTPAGLFTLGLRNAARGGGEAVTAGQYDFGKVFVLDKAIDGEYSITLFHSIWTHEKDAKQRLAALKKEGAEDSRYSFGCINVDKESYGMLVNKYESQMDGAKMFVVPDNPDSTMDFINGKAVTAGDLTRQAVQPVTKEVTKTVPGTPSAATGKTQMAARKEETAEGNQPPKRGLYREREESVAPGEGMRKEDVQRIVDDISAQWENAPKINVVQDIQELPEKLYQQMARDNAFDAPGLYDPNTKTVYLIADNIKNRTDAALTLAHESLGHYGLQSILGYTYDKTMDDIYAGNAKIRELADKKIVKGLDQRTAVEEVLAEMAEKNVSNSAVQRVMNAIRQWLRKIGVPFNSVTDNEVRALLANANRFVHGGRFRAGEESFGNQPLYREGAFNRWFGNSVVRNANGTPKVMYHGTARDIEAFRPKQAGAIFVTDDPKFADDYTFMSEDYMARDILFSLPAKEKEALSNKAKAIAKKNGTNSQDELDVLLRDMLPTRRNILPIYVSAQKPFDYENPEHITELSKQISLMGEDRADVMRGIWNVIESPRVQNAIKAAGFDGFYMYENGRKNLAVYEPSQIKSVFNKGTYDPADKRILYRTREENLTAEGQKAVELNDRMKGIANEPEQDADKSLVDRITLKAQSAKNIPMQFRQAVVDKAAPVREQLTNKFNNKVTDSLGEIRGDIYEAQAQEAAGVADQLMQRGGIRIGKDGLVEVYDRVDDNGAITLDRVFTTIVSDLGNKLGSSKQALTLAHRAFIAQRANELKKNNAVINAQADAAEAKGNKAAAKKLRDQIVGVRASQEEIDAGLEAMNSFPELRTAFTVFTKFNDGIIDFLRDTGRITPAQVQEWKENIGYVPWTRVEEESNKLEVSGNLRTGLVHLSKLPQLDKEGSSKEIRNVLDNMVGHTVWAVKSGLKNRAATKTLEQLPSANELKTQDQVDTELKNNKDRVVFTYKNGERTAYLLDNPEDMAAFSSVIDTVGPVLGFFKASSDMLRGFITHMPTFALSQLSQDTMRAMLLSGVRHPFAVPSKVMKNFYRALSGNVPEIEALGITGAYDAMPDHVIQRARERHGISEKNLWHKAWGKLEQFSLAADMAVRAAIYEQTIAETKSPSMPEGDRVLAFHRAKEYINFKRSGNGQAVRMLRHVVPFMNAYIQGMDVLYRTIQGKGISTADKKTAILLFATTGAKIAALSTLYAMLMGDDDDYKGMDEYERDKNFLIPGTNLKIPVAPEVGFLFKVIPERMYQYISREGTDRPVDNTTFLRGMRDAAISAYGGVNLAPQLVKPLIEVMTNHSFFTGNPIVGVGMPKEAVLQFRENTSELAKLAGHVGLSPMKVDYLMRAYLGTTGGVLLSVTDAIADPNRMGKPIGRMPLLSTFINDPSGRGYKSEFYTFREDVDRVVESVNMFKREGRIEELKEYLTEDKMKLYAMKGIVGKVEDYLSVLRRHRNIVANDPDMSGEEKRAKVDEIIATEKNLLMAYNLPRMKVMAGM